MKKENSKIMLWVVIALVVGLLIGFLITNATIGKAKTALSNNTLKENINSLKLITETGCNAVGGTVGPCQEPHNGSGKCCIISVEGYSFENVIFTIPSGDECTRLGGTIMVGTTNGHPFRICRLPNGFEATIVVEQ